MLHGLCLGEEAGAQNLVFFRVKWLQPAMKGTSSVHPGCHSDLSANFRNFGASNCPFKIPFKKCFKIVFLSLWRRDPVLELQFPTPLRVVLLCFATPSLQIAL